MQAAATSAARAKGSVARIAIEHEFHLGRLSGEYRAMFGELPSQTAKDAAWASMFYRPEAG